MEYEERTRTYFQIIDPIDDCTGRIGLATEMTLHHNDVITITLELPGIPRFPYPYYRKYYFTQLNQVDKEEYKLQELTDVLES